MVSGNVAEAGVCCNNAVCCHCLNPHCVKIVCHCAPVSTRPSKSRLQWPSWPKVPTYCPIIPFGPNFQWLWLPWQPGLLYSVCPYPQNTLCFAFMSNLWFNLMAQGSHSLMIFFFSTVNTHSVILTVNLTSAFGSLTDFDVKTCIHVKGLFYYTYRVKSSEKWSIYPSHIHNTL